MAQICKALLPAPEIAVAVRIGHQLERHNAGHHAQDVAGHQGHRHVLVHKANRHEELHANRKDVQQEDEALMPTDQPLSVAACLRRADHLLGTRLCCLQTQLQGGAEVVLFGPVENRQQQQPQ